MGRGGIALIFEKSCFSGLFLLHALSGGEDAVSTPRKHILARLPVQTAQPLAKPAIIKEFLNEGRHEFYSRCSTTSKA